jgi:hypothetical protein
MWSYDLPKGGFPKDLVDGRLVIDVAEAMTRADILEIKTKNGLRKYGLKNKATAQPIIDTGTFDSCPAIQTFFGRSSRLVSARVLNYDYSAESPPRPASDAIN